VQAIDDTTANVSVYELDRHADWSSRNTGQQIINLEDIKMIEPLEPADEPEA